MTLIRLFLLALFCTAASARAGILSGSEFEYTVVPGDYLIKIGARFGVSAEVIARDNGMDYGGILHPGTHLKIDNRHIVPEGMSDGILINLPQGMLFFFGNGKFMAAYPVGLGKSSWATPDGDFRVVDLQENKTWLVPKSIQQEMRREGKPVLTSVPPGPENPLGKYWIGLSINGYGIHGTNAPASVYHFQSHGCIRMQEGDIAALFKRMRIGMNGRIVYRPLLFTELGNGKIFIESHADIYNRKPDYLKIAHELAGPLGSKVDWTLAAEVIDRRDGIARDVTLIRRAYR